MKSKNILAFVLGGGKGSRLSPLTNTRAKPAVPFGGSYRVIDFVLSNLYHSGIRKICVLTQYELRSLHKHLKHGWYPKFGIGTEEFITTIPARKSSSGGWYEGTANAVAQNMSYIKSEDAELVNIFNGDHVFFMDVSQMNDFHEEKKADLTVAAIPVKISKAAKNYGVFVVDKNFRVIGFEEKPVKPTPIPGNKDYCLASMGNYAFNPDVLLEELMEDMQKASTDKMKDVREDPYQYSSHDFAHDVIPNMLRKKKNIYVYDFLKNDVPGMYALSKGFWRDIGDLDSFWKANMELRSKKSPLNLYDSKWIVLTYEEASQPVKFVGSSKIKGSVISQGSVIEPGCIVDDSVLGYEVKLKKNAKVQDCVFLGYNKLGEGCKLKKVILDKGVEIPARVKIGFSKKDDLARGFTISKGGVVVVPAGCKFEGCY